MKFASIESAIRDRMAVKDLHNDVTHEFLRRVKLVHEGFSGKIPWEEVSDITESDLLRLESLPQPDKATEKSLLNKLAVIKLNGGLGTSMGLTRAKSIIPVKENISFLEVMVKRIHHLRSKYDVALPLIFMNSFNTREDTLAVSGVASMNKEMGLDLPSDFLQNMIPRINKETLLPAGSGDDAGDWCPPGHGDIYLAMKITGILDHLLSLGYTTAFISNSDNLAADVNTAILSAFISQNLDFAMEITPKTLADVKGGVLIRHTHKDLTRVELLEAAQVDDDHLGDFKDIKRFSYFNTNNLWINLESLREKLNNATGLPLPVILNPKEVNGEEILQLETAMGSAIGQFQRSKGIIIPRNRFAPVKNCADLLVRRSDAYILNRKEGSMTPAGTEEIVVDLDDNYKKIEDFDRLIKVVPSLKECRSLRVEGSVIFDTAISISGDVKISNKSGEPIRISSIRKDSLSDETVTLG